MTENLRDRIAAALYGSVYLGDARKRLLYGSVYLGDADRYEIADAVIRELGLKREGTDPGQIISHGYPPMYRYVTEWSSDD